MYQFKKRTLQPVAAATLLALLSLMPFMALAQNTPTTFKALVKVFLEIISFFLIPLIMAVVFVFFIWKIIDAWIINAGDEKKRSEGKSYAVATVVMFVLMFSAWGLIRILASSFFGT